MRTVAIVPSAGCGKRLGAGTKKPFVLLGDRPLVLYALKALDASSAIDGIIIAAERPCVNRFKWLIRRSGIKKVVDIVIGGKTRFESVKNCLARVGPSCEIVVIHDGARPFLEKPLLERSIALAKRFGGCIVAVPETDTVKLVDVDLFIEKTLDRTRVFRAQTPQAFRCDLIKKAYADGRPGVTDDAGLLEALGKRVKILEGPYRNIKVTTKEDLMLAELLL